MGGCFVQTAAGGLCSSRVSRRCALSLGGGRQRGAEAEGEAMPLRLARAQPRLKQRGERPAHLPDPLCARPAPARPTHAMSSASAMRVHVHIPQDHPSPVHVHLCPPDGKWKPPPSGATFGSLTLFCNMPWTGLAAPSVLPPARLPGPTHRPPPSPACSRLPVHLPPAGHRPPDLPAARPAGWRRWPPAAACPPPARSPADVFAAGEVLS